MSEGRLFAVIVALYTLFVGSLQWWGYARRKRRDREFNERAALLRASLRTVDTQEQAQLAAAFQPERDRWFCIRLSLVVPALGTFLYSLIKIDKLYQPGRHSSYCLVVLVLWAVLDDFLARRLSCPRCAYVFRSRDGMNPKQCRQCGVSLTLKPGQR